MQRFHVETGVQKLKSDERLTRHWLSALSRMFLKPTCDYVIYAEDDQVVSSDFMEAAYSMIHSLDALCPTCWSINMGCRGNCWGAIEEHPSAVIRMESGNTGVIFTKSGFQTLLKNVDTFCDMLGVWDNNVHTMAARGLIKPHALTYLHKRIHHLTTCVSSRTKAVFRDRTCNWTAEIKDWNNHHQETEFDGFLLDRGIAKFHPGNKQYYPADKTTKQRCLDSVQTSLDGVSPQEYEKEYANYGLPPVPRAPARKAPVTLVLPKNNTDKKQHRHPVQLHVWTYSNDYFTHLCEYLKSALLQGIQPTLLGWGSEWHGNSDKISGVLKSLEKLPTSDLILFTDAHDVLICNTGNHIQSAFEKYFGATTDILYMAEKGCWPQRNMKNGREICDKLYPTAPTPYRYLNSGAWIGRVGAVQQLYRELMSTITLNPNLDDQHLVSDMFYKGASDLRLRLDYHNRIFQSMHDSQGEIDIVPNKTCTIYNKITKSYPMILHFNGGGKSIEQDYHSIISSAKAQSNEIAIGNQTRIHLDQVCCRYTQSKEAKRQPPSWMNCPAGQSYRSFPLYLQTSTPFLTSKVQVNSTVCSSYELRTNTNIPGSDVGNKECTTVEECCRLCNAHQLCKTFTFSYDVCWMKSSAKKYFQGNFRKFGLVSGFAP